MCDGIDDLKVKNKMKKKERWRAGKTKTLRRHSAVREV